MRSRAAILVAVTLLAAPPADAATNRQMIRALQQHLHRQDATIRRLERRITADDHLIDALWERSDNDQNQLRCFYSLAINAVSFTPPGATDPIEALFFDQTTSPPFWLVAADNRCIVNGRIHP